MKYLPDPFKLDVIKFLDSAPGRALVEVLKARAPDVPDANLPHSTKLSTFDRRAGYDLALASLREIPQELQPDTAPDKARQTLLDPRD